MPDRATITITRGPDRGKVFELREDLMNLGAGPDNQIELSDPKVEAQQASIVSRNGRFAISTPHDLTVTVDGNIIPAGRWVWLPEVARVRLTDQTSFQFNMRTAEAPPPPPGPETKEKPKRKARAKKQAANQQVAQFVTDSGGGTAVKLGDDGHLPELRLSDLATGRPKRAKQPGQASSGLYIMLGFSVLCSLAMLLVDSGSGSVSASEVQDARKSIREYYARPGEAVEPYQEHLQSARHAATRGDRAAERRAYRRVLVLLNAEDKDKHSGVTGNHERDKKLREIIGILMARRR